MPYECHTAWGRMPYVWHSGCMAFWVYGILYGILYGIPSGQADIFGIEEIDPWSKAKAEDSLQAVGSHCDCGFACSSHNAVISAQGCRFFPSYTFLNKALLQVCEAWWFVFQRDCRQQCICAWWIRCSFRFRWGECVHRLLFLWEPAVRGWSNCNLLTHHVENHCWVQTTLGSSRECIGVSSSYDLWYTSRTVWLRRGCLTAWHCWVANWKKEEIYDWEVEDETDAHWHVKFQLLKIYVSFVCSVDDSTIIVFLFPIHFWCLLSLRLYKSVETFMESCLNFMEHITLDASIFHCAQGLKNEEADLPEKASKRECLNPLSNHFQCSVSFLYSMVLILCLESFALFWGLHEFRQMFPNGSFFDLSQQPGQRARYGVMMLPTLTRTCASFWSEKQCRYLRPLVTSLTVWPYYSFNPLSFRSWRMAGEWWWSCSFFT